MKPSQALKLLRVQVQNNEQNREAIGVLESLLFIRDNILIEEEFGNELQHMINHMTKIGKQDLEYLEKIKDENTRG